MWWRGKRDPNKYADLSEDAHLDGFDQERGQNGLAGKMMVGGMATGMATIGLMVMMGPPAAVAMASYALYATIAGAATTAIADIGYKTLRDTQLRNAGHDTTYQPVPQKILRGPAYNP